MIPEISFPEVKYDENWRPCPYGPHYHNHRDHEIECRHSFIKSMPKDILMHPMIGFEEWEIDSLKRGVNL